MGIRLKIILTLSAVLFLTLSINVWLNFKEYETARMVELKNRGADINQFIAKSLSFSVIGYDYHTIQLLLDELVTTGIVSYAKVTNRKGKIMGESGNLSNYEILMFKQAIHFDNRIIGQLEIGLNTPVMGSHLTHQHTAQLIRQIVIILFIIVGEFIVLSILIVRPISKMTRAMQKSTSNTDGLIEAIETHSKDEFGEMAREFNRMSQRVNEMNLELQSEVKIADNQLVISNNQLKGQSEELKRMNKELRVLTITDPLTEVFNRRHFDELLAVEFDVVKRYGDHCSLLLIDLDDFKKVNDVHGHYTGDIVLKTTASILSGCLRKTDMLFRVGGEEFAVICKHTGDEGSRFIAEKLRKAVYDMEVEIDNKKITISTSIGISTIPSEIFASHYSRDDFYLYADRALYYSKDMGRNQATHCVDIPADYDHHINGETA